MNFRSCRYFLTVCDAGAISAAAKKLYISQQSLSQHIRRLEQELGAPLFHRDNPLTLTEAGACVERAARRILSSLEDMDRELAALKQQLPSEIVLGMLDYGTPDFVPPLVEAFLKTEPSVLIRTRDVPPGGSIPEGTHLLFSARALGPPYRSELLFSDRLVACVTDELLRQVYGGDWKGRKKRLENGDLAALERCPFIRLPETTPMHDLMERSFYAAGFQPSHFPILGDTSTLMRFCIDGQAAMITFLGLPMNNPGFPPHYPIAAFPDPIPAGYICYRKNTALPAPAQRFLELSRRFLKQYGND